MFPSGREGNEGLSTGRMRASAAVVDAANIWSAMAGARSHRIRLRQSCNETAGAR